MVSKSKTSQKMTLLLILFLSWLCFSPSSAAIDITHILGQHPELSTFSNYLTQTNLVQDINSRQTLTVLVVANSDMGPLAGKPMDQIKKILSVHVLLDYYDMAKLKNIQGKTLTVTTLLQASGQALAINNQGFINISVSTSGGVTFGSAATGVPSQTLAQLVKPVESNPYSISVLQVNAPIITILGSPAPLQSQSPMQSPISRPPTNSNTPSTPANAPTNSNVEPPTLGAPASAPPNQNENAPSPGGLEGQQNAPEPSQASNASPPLSSSFAPQPSEDGNANAPQASNASPQPSEVEAPTPTEDDANSPDGMSPTGDSPSSAPGGDSPSMVPRSGDSEVPASADGEGKKKNSAGGIAPSSSTGLIGAIILSLILGKLV